MTVLPEVLKSGIGLCVSTSLITGMLTSFMSDGATVAVIGPIAVPMATASGTPPHTAIRARLPPQGES